MAPRNGNGPRVEREPFLETRSDEGHRGNPAPYFTPITPDFKFPPFALNDGWNRLNSGDSLPAGKVGR